MKWIIRHNGPPQGSQRHKHRLEPGFRPSYLRFIASGVTGLTLCLMTATASPVAFAATPLETQGGQTSATVAIPTSVKSQSTVSAPSPAPILTLQAAKQQAMTMLNIPNSYVLQNQSYQSQGYNTQTPVYNFTFQSAQSTQASNWINVTMDANTGLILQYNRPASDNHFIFPAQTSADKAQQIALQWAQKLYPEQYPQVSLQPLTPQSGSLQGGISYTYNFVRQVNGLSAPFDGFSLTIDQNGQLTSANCHWTAQTFPSAKMAISSQQANQVYQNSLHLQLAYVQVWHPNAVPTTVLAYTQQPEAGPGWWGQQFGNQQMGQPVIDALTGKVITLQGTPVENAFTPTPQPVVPGGPVLPVQLPNVHWSESQCLSYAKKVLTLPDNANLISANQFRNSNTDTTWNFNWAMPNGTHIGAGVDTVTGQLVNFNQYTQVSLSKEGGSGSHSSSSLSSSQLNLAAIHFVKNVFTDDTGGIALVPNPFNSPNSPQVVNSYQVIPLVHGIPDMSRTGSLSVDSSTGQVQNFWMNFQTHKTSLPVPQSAISVNQAEQLWQKAQPLSLEYLMTSQSPSVYKGGPYKSIPGKIVLAYVPVTAPGSSGVFNAVTGTFESPQVPVPYTGPIHDLKGVTAAPQIQLLVQRELWNVDTQGNVHPQQVLTTGAFVKLVVNALGQQGFYNPQWANSPAAQAALSGISHSAPDYQPMAIAYHLGWLPIAQPVHPNQPISRSRAANILMQSLGFAPLFAHPEVFAFSASDAHSIPKDQWAADALASSLGVLPLENGRFNSNGTVTLADAAVAVVQTANIAGASNHLPMQPLG